MDKKSKIYVAGHRGMVGSAIMRKLEHEGYQNIVTRTREELDLINQQAVKEFFEAEKPEYVFLAAAKVGGIVANNTYRAEFIYQNLMIDANIIHHAYLSGTKRLLFLGSTCVYPKKAPQPLKEEYLLSGYLEETNEPYAIAKVTGVKLCENYKRQYGCDFFSVMPTNMYGPNDNYDLITSHVLPALIKKFHAAKQGNSPTVTVWGSGKPRREFLHVDDCAEACYFLMKQEKIDYPLIYIGTGTDLTIKEAAELIKGVVGFKGEIVFDNLKPDGTMRKLADVSIINSLGWKATVGLREGIEKVYKEAFKL